VNRQTNDILAMGINQRYAQDINTLVLKNGSGFHVFYHVYCLKSFDMLGHLLSKCKFKGVSHVFPCFQRDGN